VTQPSAADDQSAPAPSAAKRAPRTTTPRTSGTTKAPAKRPSAARTTAGADSTDATGAAKKTTTTRSTGSRTTAAKTGTARTTAAKTGTARTTAAKRTPAKASPETDPSTATPESPDDGSTPAAPASTPRAPRTTTRTTGASSGTKSPAAKTGTSRTTAAKSTTTRTPAKRTPARSGTARTTAPKQTEQTAAASAGVLDEVRAPVVGDAPAPEAEAASAQDVDTTVTPTEPDRRDGSAAGSEPTSATTGVPITAPETTSTTTTEAPRPSAASARTEPASDAQDAPSSVAAAPVAPKRPVARPTTKPPSTPAESPAAGKGADTAAPEANPIVLSISGLVKQFGDTVAVDGVDLEVRRGSFYGIVGPNGAGKTTTLSMVTGLLRPDAGSIRVQGVDVWQDPAEAKRAIGVLPDRLRLFDRLTGNQLLYYSGVLRGLDPATVKSRTTDLARAFGLDDALGRLVSDYSAGMTKKIALAAALIHSPRLLILDEPFESVDPVSAANVIEILQRYVANGGTVVLSSHGMDFIQRVCDHVAIIVQGKVLAAGSVDEVRGTGTLEERFVELAGGRKSAEGMEWLHSFSD